jgi:hypothetical protein
MPKIGQTQFDLGGEEFKETPVTRAPMRVDLGCAVTGAAQPVPDNGDSANFFLGLQHRVGRAPPLCSKFRIRSLRRFTRRFCRRHWRKLRLADIPDFETWLTSRPYTQSRKRELLACWNSYVDGIPFRNLEFYATFVNAFIKDECYDGEFKVPRGIYSRHDIFKCITGPLFSAMESVIFGHRAFIKKIPAPDRPAYTMDTLFAGDDLLDGDLCEDTDPTIVSSMGFHRKVDAHFVGPRTDVLGNNLLWRSYGSDYSSFESHFSPQIMSAIEFEVYNYLCSDLPGDYRDLLSYITGTLAGVNKLNNRKFGSAFIRACRMSGEMNTSLGNGVTNLITNAYVLMKIGAKNVTGIVEGDDGLFRYYGREVTAADFKECGWTIKITHVTEANEASFCGMVFDDMDQINVTNPISGLLEFGWAGALYSRSSLKTKMQLLRAKSLSLIFSYPGCPILQELGQYGLRMTEGQYYKIPRTSLYEQEEYVLCMDYIKKNGLPTREIPNATRLLVERLYKIPIATQMSIEGKLRSLDKLQPLDFPELQGFYTDDQISYYDLYCYNHADTADLLLNRQLVKTVPLRFERGHDLWKQFFYI